MMKKLFTLLAIAFCFNTNAQSTYASSNYAASGDTLYLTSAQITSTNYDTTGAGITWNYAGLTGISQQRLIYRLPTQAGFTSVQWHYVYVPSNVNLSSTNGQTIAAGNLEYTDPNDYYLLNSSLLEEKASSYKVTINSTTISVKNVYTAPDVLYKFPLNYGNSDSSIASYNINIPSLYYKSTSIHRVNHVKGWGTVITPYGTFANALKVESDVMEIDSIRVDTSSFPKDTSYYRELKWLDPSKTYPVLYVKQNKVGNTYVTQIVQYLDNQKYFQPNALFAYLPLTPATGDTVTFQNLSTNALKYSWNFHDPSSGTSDTSTLINPQHIFMHPGTYSVELIAYNGPLSDTVKLPVVVDTIPKASFTYSPAVIYTGDTVHYANTSTYTNNYKWFFGDITSGNKDSSVLVNPTHVYNTAGTYTVSLIGYSSAGNDTAHATIVVHVQTTAIKNVNESDFLIYPNPNNGSFVIEPNSTTKQTVQVYDVNGKMVVNQTINGKTTIDASSLNEGVYNLSIINNEGIVNKKLVIVR